jgi:hypothetical protein
MGMLTKSALAGGAAALASEDADAGVVIKNGIPMIKSYHGGPSGMKRLDSSFIGTGEGAQAFSHGSYSADRKGTATSYKEQRQAVYEREYNKNIFTDVIEAHSSNDLPLEFKIGDAKEPFYIDSNRYMEIVNEQVERYGGNVDAVKDAVARSLSREDMSRAERMRKYAANFRQNVKSNNFDDQDKYLWELHAEQFLAEINGTSVDDFREIIEEELLESYNIIADDLDGDTYRKLYQEMMAQYFEAEESRYRKASLDRYQHTKERAQAYEKSVKFYGAHGKNTPQKKPPNEEGFDYVYQKPASISWTKEMEPADFEKIAEGRRQASLYEVMTYATPDELLRWDVDIRNQSPFVQRAVQNAMRNLDNAINEFPDRFDWEYLNDVSGFGTTGLQKLRKTISRMANGEFDRNLNGAALMDMIAPPSFQGRSYKSKEVIAPSEFSDLLSSEGIKGMMYPDRVTRNKDGEKSFNYAWYRDDIHEDLKELGFTLPMVPVSMALASSIPLAAPVLDKEIAERFPLPQPEATTMERIEANPNVQAAMSHPITQYIGQQFENAEWPERLMSGIVEGIHNLSNGVKPEQAGQEFVERIKTPYDQTLDDLGNYVLDETNSPALATGAYMGGMMLSPSNFVGP